MKIELKIDGMQVRMNQKANIAVTHSIADLQEPDNTSAGYSKSVEVPLIPWNMRVFRFTNELYSKELFNNELHTAEYIVDGNTVMSGVAQIDKITYKFEAGRKLIGGSFHVSIIGAAFEWITQAKRQMNELTSDETVKYAMEDVYKNSTQTDVSLIKFFPVDRGAFWRDENGVKVPRTYLELKDYHPFFNVWKALGLIFGDYTVKSSMKGLFESLYCSGYIPEQEDLSYIKEENDFYVGTSATETGMKVADIRPAFSALEFDLYDTWNTGDYHNNKGVVSRKIIDGQIYTTFTPTATTVVQFETDLQYVTSIENGSTGGYYNDIIVDDGECFYVDKFQQVVGNKTETHVLTLDKCLEADIKNRKGDISNVFIPADSTAGHTYIVYLESRLPEVYALIQRNVSPAVNLGYMKKGGNWYVVYAPKSISGGYYFDIRPKSGGMSSRVNADNVSDFFYFEISDNQVSFNLNNLTKNAYTLHKGVNYPIYAVFSCSHKFAARAADKTNGVALYLYANNNIKPTFPNIIGLNEPVGISTIGGTNMQIDFIAALRQMFNLMFYTNPLTKEVFIEPRTRFYNLERADIVDWRGKIDYSKEIEIEELGEDVGKSLKLAYADGNEVVQYYNWKRNTELGAYKEALLNKTSDDTKEVVNTMFAPFLLRTVESVGMTIPQEKRENTQDIIEDVDLNLTPIVGYFNGVVNRTAGSDKGKYPSYPQLIFQDASKAVNLGFDDIDWMPTEYGLNQYYKDNISAYNVGRRITMYLKLTPQDVEAFQFPNRLMRDFRAVFLLNIDGEDVPCLLESIEDYNPASGASTKCIFISDPNLKLTGNDLVVITYDDVAIGRNNTLLGYK